MQTRSPFLLALPLLVGFVIAAGLQAAAPLDRPLQSASQLEIPIPMAVRGLLLENPSVTFLVSVDENGRLVEHMPTGATHYKLLEAAEKCLLEAKFEPALKDGRPVGSTGPVVVYFFDPDQRAYFQGLIDVPYAHSPGDVAERRLYLLAKNQYTFQRSKPAELDRPIEVTEAKVMLYTDKSGRVAHGHCMVEYWVDRDGTVKFPRIVQSDNEAVSTSALLTLQKTKFVPPTRNGNPTYVQVRQPMDFDTAPDAAPAPAKG